MTVDVPHIPVMLPEVLSALAPQDGEVYVDGTFGAGGYTRAILAAAKCKVIAIDRDESAIARAYALRDAGADIVPVHGTFGDVKTHLSMLGVERVNGFVMDLGVSSMQIDTPERGFSFMRDGALDMRMDTSGGESAADLVANLSESELADIIYQYGEERQSRGIARAIVAARAEAPITTTLQLADIVSKAVRGGKKYSIHPATRTFQALRIAVNGELDQLEAALDASVEILAPEGRLVVVSFHSLEDSMAKRFMKAHSQAPAVSRYEPVGDSTFKADFKSPAGKAIAASEAECQVNIRARSAKLRAAVKV